MYSKSYNDLLNSLRTREARPPFVRMAELIATTPARKPIAIPLFAKFLGAIVLGGAIAAGIFLQSRRGDIKIAGDVSHRSANFSRSIKFQRNGIIAHNSFGTLPDSAPTTSATRASNSSSIVLSGLHDSVEEEYPIYARIDARESAITFPTQTHDTPPAAPIAFHDSDSENPHYFFATVGGAITQQFSSNSLFRQFSFSDAFAGVGYHLSQNSSVHVLGGEEVFALSQNSYYVTYHDTTFYHNGTPYPNIIGQVNPTAGSTLTRVYWLGASYRYSFASGSVRPFAEVMAGGSSDGVITHQSVGAELSITDNIGLGLLLHADELLPQNSVWLTKAGFAAALSYAW